MPATLDPPTNAVPQVAVNEATAARMISVSTKTLGRLPDDLVGRFRIGRAVRYKVEAIKAYVEQLTSPNTDSVNN